MEYDSNFIDFCEHIDQEDMLYYYLRYLLYTPLEEKYWAFDSLYNSYCNEYLIEKTEKHFNLCKFYAFEYFYDMAFLTNELKKNIVH